MTEDGTKKVTEGTKERSGSGVKNTKDSSERNSTDSGFKRLKVKIRYSYSFVKEFDFYCNSCKYRANAGADHTTDRFNWQFWIRFSTITGVNRSGEEE